MQVKIFTVPIISGEQINDELNRFLRSQKIVEIDKQIVTQAGNSYWSFCVTYLPVAAIQSPEIERREKVDYKKVLDEQAFKVFTILRTLRKRIADREAIPAYAVFTDAELAEIAKIESPDAKKIRVIPGVGEKKIEKYGAELCQMLEYEKGGLSD